MNRRQLLHLWGGTLLGRGPSGSPAERAGYLRRMLDSLCTRLGPRPAGSRAFDAGARLIPKEMESALPSVALDTFTITAWEPAGEAEFELGDRRLETYIAENSPGTGAEGVHGRLRKGGAQYEIADVNSGGVLARAGISEFGRAVASLHPGTDQVPLFNLGRQDVALLDRGIEQGLPTRAKALVRWVPGVKTSNVAGTIPGRMKEEILLVAHADTKYNTPGANDNTASLVCMLMLAHAFSGTRHLRAITFLATTAEERGYLGAKHYAETRKQQGSLSDIRTAINLDSLTYGPNLQIATTDEGLQRMILDAHREAGLHSQPKVLHQDDTMDSAPFRAAGARTVHLNSRGDDARTLPLWHRPEDQAETVKPEFIEDSFQVLLRLCERLQA